MFYEASPEEALRFGDVVRGFISLTPVIPDPPIDNDSSYTVMVHHGYCAVLSPCCSIRDHLISLAPLKKINSQWLKNDYFAQDLTNINRIMEPQQAIGSAAWVRLDDSERARRSKEGLTYTRMETFIYEGHGLLASYAVHPRGQAETSSYYMIDFRDAFTVNCSRVSSPADSPIRTKVLQLSVATRQELRDKIMHYFARIPEEEMARVG